jgi:deazaflavin-dependent oxidoreductase (nitroreductase family)
VKRKLVTAFQRHLFNPLMRAADRLGLLPSSVAILETTGRKTGRPRRTPVGNGLEDDTLTPPAASSRHRLAPRRSASPPSLHSASTFWLVSEHGYASDYVRNIQANPRVRVKVGGRWRTGTAHVLPDEDPLERQRKMWNKRNASAVRRFGTDLLVVRIDLTRDQEDAPVV